MPSYLSGITRSRTTTVHSCTFTTFVHHFQGPPRDHLPVSNVQLPCVYRLDFFASRAQSCWVNCPRIELVTVDVLFFFFSKTFLAQALFSWICLHCALRIPFSNIVSVVLPSINLFCFLDAFVHQYFVGS